ncbi:transmembrane protein 130 [Discoglossus pictus]
MASGCTPWTHCWALLAAVVTVISGDVVYILEVSTDGPITSGAQANVNATLFMVNGSTTLVADSRLYRFHWSYSPLELTHQSENDSASAISVMSWVPGSYPISVWVTERHCHACHPIARSETQLCVIKSIVGSLTASQVEDKSTPLARGFVLATDRDVQFSFLLHDPSGYFRTAVFSYKWSFGDGSEIETDKPFVCHVYSRPGRYKASLQVSAHIQRHSVQKRGTFTADLTLLDVLRNITVIGSTETRTGHKFNLTLNFLGSPPLAVCWLIKSDCVSLDGDKCRPVDINGTTYSIIHVFNDAGQYCLSVRARNGVSVLQKYYSITVYSTGLHPLWFILPCGTFIVMALVVIFLTLIRSGSSASGIQRKSQIEVADFDFSPDPDRYQPLPDYRDSAPGACWDFCSTDKFHDDRQTHLETQPLLHQLSTPVRSYSL